MAEVVVHGTLRPDGTLAIDQPVALPPGEVRLTIEALTSKPRREVMEVLEEIWTERRKFGMEGRSKEQIDADIDVMRNEWEDRQRELDSAPRAGVMVLVYLDSNIVIYLIEQPAQFGRRASARLASLTTAGDEIVVSELSRLECRSNAVASADQRLLSQYDAFFDQAAVRLMPLSRAVVDRATEIRGQYRFKTPDALHLAAAVEASCQIFLTNDLRLSRFPDLIVEMLP